MNAIRKFASLGTIVTAAAFMAAGCSSTGMKQSSADIGMSALALSGAQEVPPVSSGASGKSTIKIAADKSASGSVTVSGMTPTAAHIHMGAPGTNGPVIIPLAKTAENTFAVPPNTKLTDDQYSSYVAGNLYVNVHSAAYPAGEVRAQLRSK